MLAARPRASLGAIMLSVTIVGGLVPRVAAAEIRTPLAGAMGSSGREPIASNPPAASVIVGAGDIATCTGSGDEATAALLDGIRGTVITLGDNAYKSGTEAEFADCYHPTWGRHRDRTRPTPGNHDYLTPGATGYFGYFGSRAGDPGRGWYAFDKGSWRVYALNSNCAAIGGCGSTSPQVRWLLADLASQPRRCVAAYWHHPLFSSGSHGGDDHMKRIWEILDEAGAELVISGHDHDYERFARMHADGTRSTSGIRQFVVGTGGGSLRQFFRVRPNSQIRDASTYGVLRVTLGVGHYRWAFMPAAGGTFSDTGTNDCV